MVQKLSHFFTTERKMFVLTFLSNALRTTKIQINGVTMLFSHFSSFQKDFSIIGAKLDEMKINFSLLLNTDG